MGDKVEIEINGGIGAATRVTEMKHWDKKVKKKKIRANKSLYFSLLLKYCQ